MGHDGTSDLPRRIGRMFGEEVGPANTQYTDWTGTTAMDGDADFGRMYDLCGIGRDEWWIVGVSIYREQGFSSLTVYAVPTAEAPDYEHLQELGQQHNGKLPVTEFRLDEVDAWEFIDKSFKRFHVVATLRKQIVDQGMGLIVTAERSAEDGNDDDDTGV
jgi:hypothetical protein